VRKGGKEGGGGNRRGSDVLKHLGLRRRWDDVESGGGRQNNGCGALTWHNDDCFGKCRATPRGDLTEISTTSAISLS
jgi:hypothetical protein